MGGRALAKIPTFGQEETLLSWQPTTKSTKLQSGELSQELINYIMFSI
jgi:hypothetical protein